MAQLKLRDPFAEASAPPPVSTPLRDVAATPVAEGKRLEELGELQEGQGPHPTIRLSVDLERPLHRRLRRWALDQERTASDVIRELLTSALDGAGY
jgi:hypothetical protein